MPKKYLIIIGAAFLALVIGTTSGMFVYWNIMLWNKVSSIDKKVNPPVEVEEEEAGAEEEGPAEKIGPMHPLDTFIVNLADEGGRRYLRITINLELKDDTVQKKVEQRIPEIRNRVLMILPTKKVEDIKDTTGKMVLRDEIHAGINSILGEGSVTNIYFTEFVMQ